MGPVAKARARARRVRALAPTKHDLVADTNFTGRPAQEILQAIETLPAYVRLRDPNTGQIVNTSRKAQARYLARQFTVDAVQALLEVATSPNPKYSSARVAAAEALLDRGWGRPVTPIAPVQSLTDAELRTLAMPILETRLGTIGPTQDTTPSVDTLPNPTPPDRGGSNGIWSPETSSSGGHTIPIDPFETNYTEYNEKKDGEDGKG